MTRALAATVVTSLALLGACSRSDDRSVAGVDSSTESGSPAATAAAATAAPATTSPMPVTDQDACEDVPDPADHPRDAPVVVLRPCTVPTELGVHLIHDGTGRAAENGDTLIVDYAGVRAATGELFDTSSLRGVPLDFVLGRGSVILGWDIGLLGATAGEVVKLDVPAAQAYGDTPPSDAIQPGDALSFMVEVRAVIAPVTAADAPLDLLVTPSTDATTVGTVDVTVGDGAVVEAGMTVVAHVLLVRADNLVVLLNTWEASDPLQIVLSDGQSLPGIVEGLQGATVGTTRVITMPPESAFGPQGESGLGLPAGVDLMVVADIVGVY